MTFHTTVMHFNCLGPFIVHFTWYAIPNCTSILHQVWLNICAKVRNGLSREGKKVCACVPALFWFLLCYVCVLFMMPVFCSMFHFFLFLYKFKARPSLHVASTSAVLYFQNNKEGWFPKVRFVVLVCYLITMASFHRRLCRAPRGLVAWQQWERCQPPIF